MLQLKRGLSVVVATVLSVTTVVVPAQAEDIPQTEKAGTLPTGSPFHGGNNNYNLFYGITSPQEVADCQPQPLTGVTTDENGTETTVIADVLAPELMCPAAPISRTDWSVSALLAAVPEFFGAMVTKPFSGAALEIVMRTLRAITYLVVAPSTDAQDQYKN